MQTIIKVLLFLLERVKRQEPKIDCFVIHFNRPSFLERLLHVLSSNPRLKIYLIDNRSIIENRKKSEAISKKFRAKFISMDRNYGHQVVWSQGLSRSISGKAPYIVTDCDVIPPRHTDYLEILERGLNKYPHVTKAGLDLDVSRIPLNYPKRSEVIQHERGYIYRKILDADFQEAPVDTTFALYRGGYHAYSVWGTSSNEWEGRCLALRTAKPELEADHLGWHVTPPYDAETRQYFDIIRSLPTGHWKD
jgi:hypothetical protein